MLRFVGGEVPIWSRLRLLGRGGPGQDPERGAESEGSGEARDGPRRDAGSERLAARDREEEAEKTGSEEVEKQAGRLDLVAAH